MKAQSVPPSRLLKHKRRDIHLISRSYEKQVLLIPSCCASALDSIILQDSPELIFFTMNVHFFSLVPT